MQSYKDKYLRENGVAEIHDDKSIFWTKSFIQKVDDAVFLVVPVKFHDSPSTYLEDGSKINFSDASFMVASVFPDSLHFEVLTKIPDRDYLLSNETYPVFTGRIFVKDIYGNYIRN